MKTVSSIYLAHIYDACVEHGANSAELLAFIPGGDKAVRIPHARFPVQCVFDILTHTEKQTGKPEIGLLTGQSLRAFCIWRCGARDYVVASPCGK